MLNKVFVAIAFLYLIATAAAGTSALLLTLWAYNIDDRMLSDIVTATIRNTAAAMAAMGFFGGGDMFFTIWQFLRNQEAEKARNQEREEERQSRRAEQEALRTEREEERQSRRAEQEALRTEREEQHQARRAEQEARRAEQEALRAEQEARRAEQEEQREARRAEREEHRAERAEFIALLQAERARNEALTAHILELTELVISRRNGNGNDANGRGHNADTAPPP